MAALQQEIKKKKAFDLPEQEAYLNVMRTASHLAAAFDALFKSHGLSQPQYNVLRILRGEGCKIPSLACADRLVTRVPDITRLVNRLEAAGLAKRERCTHDRRVVYLVITPKGLDVLAALDEPVRELHRQQLSHMSKTDLKSLSTLLVKARAVSDAQPE